MNPHLLGLDGVDAEALHEAQHLVVGLGVRGGMSGSVSGGVGGGVRGAAHGVGRRGGHGVWLRRHPTVLLDLLDGVPLHRLQY